MASFNQRIPSGNDQPTDLEHINRNFNPDQKLSVYGPPEDRRMQTGSSQGQDMEDLHLDRDNRAGYRHEPRYAPSPSVARARGGIQSLEYDYVGETEFRGALHSRDDFAPRDDNPYGNSQDTTRGRISDNATSHGNAEYLSGNRHRTSNGELYFGNTAMDVEDYDDDDNDDDEMEDGEGLFVPEDSQVHSTQQLAKSRTRKSGRPLNIGEFNVPLAPNPRLPSRSSGSRKRPHGMGVNKVPPTVPTSSISDAALLKRGLNRSRGAVMSKRSHGPNDPENILIVNLRENENKSWPEICLTLNERRIQEGKMPSFTPNGCHNRYNRNAPILFAAEGKEFIPVNVQRKLNKNPKGPMKWNDDADTLLIRAVKEVDSRKWAEVAELFNKHSSSHITPVEAALRTKVI